MDQGPNYFGAIADLAKDVGAVKAQVDERVTYKELMLQNTQQRGEIAAKMDKIEAHISSSMASSNDALNARLDALVERLDQLTQAQAAQLAYRPGGGGGRVTLGSIAGTLGAAAGVALYMLLRNLGIAP